MAFGESGSRFHTSVCGEDSAEHPFTPREGRVGVKILNSVLLEWAVASRIKAVITTQLCKQ